MLVVVIARSNVMQKVAITAWNVMLGAVDTR